MKRGVIFIMLLFVVLLQTANGQDIERNILFISGASSMEEVGVEVMERFYGLRMRPIPNIRLHHCLIINTIMAKCCH